MDQAFETGANWEQSLSEVGSNSLKMGKFIIKLYEGINHYVKILPERPQQFSVGLENFPATPIACE